MSDPEVPPPEAGLPDARQVMMRRLAEAGSGSAAIDLALRYAALSGLFLPEEALATAGLGKLEHGADIPPLRVAVVARLADDCDTRLWHPQWIMRNAARARWLQDHRGKLADLVAWRGKQAPFGKVEADLGNALLGKDDFSPESIAAALSDPQLAPDHLERLVRGLTFAGAAAPAAEHLDAARASLTRAKALVDPDIKLIESGVFGRDDEIARLEQLIDRQLANGPGGKLGLAYVGGIGGVGKSTLLAQVRHRQRAKGALCVVLDFDRPGIEGSNAVGLSREIARQVTELLGAAASSLLGQISRASSTTDTERSSAQQLLAAVGQVLRAAAPHQPVLLSLDTLESLTLRGDSAAFGLIEWLRIAKQILPHLAIIGAGREAMPRSFAEEAVPIALDQLPDGVALSILTQSHGIFGQTAEKLVALARGNPLVLRLGARLVTAAGSAARLDDLPPGAQAHVQAGLLYRLILSRISEPKLRAVAHPGLLLAQINPELLAEVIAPELGLGPIDQDGARHLLDQLGQHAWLVARQGDWLIHRSDLRPLQLEAQLGENPTRARRIFRAAAAWHAKHGPPELALYYRLQGLRWDARAFTINADVARRVPEGMVEELPPRARDLLLRARGERSSAYREEQVSASGAYKRARRESESLSLNAAEEVRGLLEKNNRAEAVAMISRVRDFGDLEVASKVGGSVIEALWLAGKWRDARRLLRRRRRALRENWLEGWDNFHLVAALADLDPLDLRAILRREGPLPRLIGQIILEMGTRDEWRQACLLAHAEGVEHRNRLIHAVFETWTGEPPSFTTLAKLRQSLDISLPADEPENLGGLIDHYLPDSMHTQIVQFRLQSFRGAELERHQLLAQATLLASGKANAAEGNTLTGMASTFALDKINSYGLLAEYLTAMEQFQPSLRLTEVTGAARRMHSTMAGYWAFGRPPRGWRPRATDWLTGLALGRLASPADDGRSLALAELENWSRGYGTDSARAFTEMLSRSRALVASAPLPVVETALADVETTAQILIDNRVPLQLVPSLAILARVRTSLTPSDPGNGPTP